MLVYSIQMEVYQLILIKTNILLLYISLINLY
nr:MAG TPA: hypothetical protein [Bacteriophage sp.]